MRNTPLKGLMRAPNPKGVKSPFEDHEEKIDWANAPAVDNTWSEQVFSAQRRGQEAEKKIKEQIKSGEVKKVQNRMSGGNSGAVPLGSLGDDL